MLKLKSPEDITTPIQDVLLPFMKKLNESNTILDKRVSASFGL